MREIKFRAKKQHWKDFVGWDEWLYANGYYFDGFNHWFTLPDDKPIKSLNGNTDTYPIAWTKHIIIDPKTLGQYTGLPDKNGKEIYDGDKIRAPGTVEEGMYWEVLWHENGWCLRLHSHFYQNLRHIRPIYIDDDDEVIGNIYENKELSNDKS